jgi:hypothetical protein
MDFAKLDLRTTAEEEHWLHLRIGDTYLYLDAAKQDGPCRVKVLSVANDAVEKALKVGTRTARAVAAAEAQLATANRQQKAEWEGRLDALEKQLERASQAFLMAAIVGWENIHVDGKSVPFTKEALADFSEPKAPFARLATAIMDDMGNLANPLWKPLNAS